MPKATCDVAIIGAGFTGSALAIQLSRHLPRGSHVVLIGSPQATGRGLAYGTELDDHLLNVRAGRMSLFPDDPAHFVRWFERVEGNGAPGSEGVAERYLPRAAFGRYVRDTLHRAIVAARGRVRIDIVEGTAVELGKGDRDFAIRLASGQEFAAIAVALCLGNRHGDFPLRQESIPPAARGHMIRDPFTDYRLRTIAPDASVLLIGAGLTMVDQVLALDRAGYSRRITAVSRHGLLPAAHLDQRTEPVTIDLPAGPPPLIELFRRVKRAARGADDWRSVVDGLRPSTQSLWQGLSPADRRRFMRHLETFWSVHRHRMAPPIAERVAEAQKAKRLTVRAGRILGVRKATSGVTAVFQGRNSSTIELLPFDWLVNCSGTGGDPAEDPFIARLLAHGFARPDPLGRGLDVAADNRVVGRSGAPIDGLFALGPVTVGRYFEITAVPDIREQVVVAAGQLAQSVDSRTRFAPLPRGNSFVR